MFCTISHPRLTKSKLESEPNCSTWVCEGEFTSIDSHTIHPQKCCPFGGKQNCGNLDAYHTYIHTAPSHPNPLPFCKIVPSDTWICSLRPATESAARAKLRPVRVRTKSCILSALSRQPLDQHHETARTENGITNHEVTIRRTVCVEGV